MPVDCRNRQRRVLRPLLVLLMLCIGAAAHAVGNKVSLDVRNAPLENVLRSIEKQTDYRFFYSKETVNVSNRVSVSARNESIRSVLDRILPPQGISYVIENKRIALKQASASSTNKQLKAENNDNKVRITGTVTDGHGEPLTGVSVMVQGERIGVITDIDGNYEIEVPQGSQLRFSYIGYTPEKKKADKSGKLDVVMTEDSQLLSEVVVIGYGTMDKKELTSAISHVGEKDFLTISSSDPAMLIQGKVPGVSISNTGAADPNNQSSIQIRGVASRSAGISPLIVIDGVPGGSLANVNPNDIASFDILIWI